MIDFGQSETVTRVTSDSCQKSCTHLTVISHPFNELNLYHIAESISYCIKGIRRKPVKSSKAMGVNRKTPRG